MPLNNWQKSPKGRAAMARASRKWKQKNRESQALYMKKWRARNCERLKEYETTYNKTEHRRKSKKKYNFSPHGILRNSQRSYVYRLRVRYGLSVSEYEAMLASQNNCCAMCKGNRSGKRRLAVDHCHKTSKVRGLLCAACNRVLGFANESSEILLAAIKYLDSHTEKVVDSIT